MEVHTSKQHCDGSQVTLQSLLRSDRLEEQGSTAAARQAADKGAAALVAEPAVSVEDVFTAGAGRSLPTRIPQAMYVRRC